MKKKTPFDKLLKTTGIVLIIASIFALMWSGNTPTVDTSDAAKQAITEQVSTSLSVGTILMSSDENIGAKDYTIALNCSSPTADYTQVDSDVPVTITIEKITE